MTCQPFGTAPFAFQWLSNGVPIPGVTGSSLTVGYASWLADTNAQYQVVVANNWGSITSSVAVINLAPLNYSQPTITPVYSFGTNGSDGAHLYAGLTLGPDGNFYGTAWSGGTGGYGTAFRFTTNGTLTTLVNFNYANGAYPVEDLTSGPDGKLYGTTADGGSGSSGTVFTLTTNGTLTTLVNFNGSANGANPRGDLMLAPDGNFYGTTANGGSSSDGSVFKMTSDGMLTPLASFNFINGAYPFSGLALGPDGNFYGTIYLGGNGNGSGSGTVFEMTANGMLTTLVSFNNINGAYPFADLTPGPDGSFYGTTWEGGDAGLNNGLGVGIVFKVSSNGTLANRHMIWRTSSEGSVVSGVDAVGVGDNFSSAMAFIFFLIKVFAWQIFCR